MKTPPVVTVGSVPYTVVGSAHKLSVRFRKEGDTRLLTYAEVVQWTFVESPSLSGASLMGRVEELKELRRVGDQQKEQTGFFWFIQKLISFLGRMHLSGYYNPDSELAKTEQQAQKAWLQLSASTLYAKLKQGATSEGVDGFVGVGRYHVASGLVELKRAITLTNVDTKERVIIQLSNGAIQYLKNKTWVRTTDVVKAKSDSQLKKFMDVLERAAVSICLDRIAELRAFFEQPVTTLADHVPPLANQQQEVSSVAFNDRRIVRVDGASYTVQCSTVRSCIDAYPTGSANIQRLTVGQELSDCQFKWNDTVVDVVGDDQRPQWQAVRQVACAFLEQQRIEQQRIEQQRIEQRYATCWERFEDLKTHLQGWQQEPNTATGVGGFIILDGTNAQYQVVANHYNLDNSDSIAVLPIVVRTIPGPIAPYEEGHLSIHRKATGEQYVMWGKNPLTVWDEEKLTCLRALEQVVIHLPKESQP